MTVHLVTFSDESMSISRDLCVRSAIIKGGIGSNEIHRYSPWEIKGHVGGWTEVHETYEAHRALFDAERGCGYWAWKPLLIYYYALANPFLSGIDDGDIVIYADAGIEFLNNVNHIIDRMDQDIFLFGNMYEHAHWCKRDIVEALFPPESVVYMFKKYWSEFGKQVQASVIFFRVSDYARAFVKEWLDWCLFDGGRLIDDSPSRTPNHPEFQENRHDQAILTTMAYRDGIKLHWWPASYNDGAFTYERGNYSDEGYPVLFNHHRKRNNEWSVAV